MPDTTAKYPIARPQTIDPINGWPTTMRSALDWLAANIATAITTTPRPAAGLFGRLHRAADGTISFDTGSAWVELSRSPHAARHAAGGDDPLTVTLAMLGADVPTIEVGDMIATASTVLPASGRFAWVNGGLIRADLYPVYMANVGHAYNGGLSPGNDAQGNPLVKLPDKRDRVSVGADTMGGSASGGRIVVGARARGQNGGEERHALLAAESGVNGSGSTVGVGDHAHLFTDDRGINQGAYSPPADTGNGFFHAYEGQTRTTAPSGGHAHGFNARNADAAHNVLQPYEVDNWKVRIA